MPLREELPIGHLFVNGYLINENGQFLHRRSPDMYHLFGQEAYVTVTGKFEIKSLHR